MTAEGPVTGAIPAPGRGRRQVLVVRTDSDGDVLLCGPAVRAVARHADVTLLVSPAGAAAARLLPDVVDVLVLDAPWSGYRPPPVDPAALHGLVAKVAERRFDAAIVLISYHQSPLPVALLLRLAGVAFIAARSEDYPGSLLDLRHPAVALDDPRHEVQRQLDLVSAAGFGPGTRVDERLALRRPLSPLPPDVADAVPARPFVVLHPGASVPARAPRPDDAASYAAALASAGWPVLVTGSPSETALTAHVVRRAAQPAVVDLGGRTSLAELATVLDGAACVVVGNTGPAHLAAAVGTPVVSLFAPVVPAAWWRPWGVGSVLLGRQDVGCAGSRARDCPVAGHPCLAAVTAENVVEAVTHLTGDPRDVAPAGTGGRKAQG